jgi:hypothetical protein
MIFNLSSQMRMAPIFIILPVEVLILIILTLNSGEI